VIEPGKQEIVSTTVLDAPRELVFRAYTDPKLFRSVVGTAPVRDQDGQVRLAPGWLMARHPRRRGRRTARFPRRQPRRRRAGADRRHFRVRGRACHVALNTATFEALGNKTRLVAHQVFQSVADRDGMVASGMEGGANESMERLAELLEQMKAGRA